MFFLEVQTRRFFILGLEAEIRTRTLPDAYVLDHDQERAPHPQQVRSDNPYVNNSTRLRS